ncbi:MAG: hypothetical protein CMB49_03665, partial [Euryarchaeota archaeon]|nr:hypothetical protein [Euryarchaeota archaeon]
MRIFRSGPKLSEITIPKDLMDQEDFLLEVAEVSSKRFTNLARLQRNLSKVIDKENLDEQVLAISHLISELFNMNNGRVIAEDLFVASIRLISELDMPLALRFGEQNLDLIELRKARRALVTFNMRANNFGSALHLLKGFSDDDEWANRFREIVQRRLKSQEELLLKRSDPSRRFNIIAPSSGGPRRSDLKVACLLDRFSFDCLSYELDLIPVTKRNWRSVLQRDDIDFFLAESIWKGHDEGWIFAMTSFNTPAGTQLREMLEYCRENNLKTVFWNKEDPTNFESFIEVASYFDYIFTTDEGSIENYIRKIGHQRVYSMPFAAQQRIHNPVRNTLPSLSVCFAGSWYYREHGTRKEDTKMLVEASTEFGLDIYDRFFGTDDKNRFPSKYLDYIRGSLSYEEVCMAYRSYKVFLNVNSVRDSMTMFSRRVFEILASSTRVLSSPSIGMEKMLAQHVDVAHDIIQAKSILGKIFSDEFESTKTAHAAYRHVMNNHTYEVRIEDMLQQIGFENKSGFNALISCITCTKRVDFLPFVLENFARQNYQNKELVIVVEANDERFEECKEIVGNRPEIRLIQVDSDISLGECLNIGIDESNGAIISKFDDDDYYLENYLSDSIIPFRYTDAQI